MAEFEFETRLDRMFSDAQSFDDAGSFAARVQAKLNRSWTTRRMVIGALGGLGGVIGVAQIINSGVLGHLDALSSDSTRLASVDIGHWVSTQVGAMSAPLTSGAAWIGLAAVGVAVAVVLTRFIEDI